MSVTAGTSTPNHSRLARAGRMLKFAAALWFLAVAATSFLFPSILCLSCLTLPSLLVACALVTGWLSEDKRYRALFLSGMSGWIIFFALSWGRLEVVNAVCWGDQQDNSLSTAVARIAWQHFYRDVSLTAPLPGTPLDELSDCPGVLGY